MNQKKFWFVNRVKIFNSLVDEDAQFLENMCEAVRLKRKQPIFLPGDPSDKVFILKSGLVKISKVTEDGKELTLMFLSQGDIFGEMAVIEGGSRNTLAEAYEDSVVCLIEREDFLNFIVERPKVSLEVIRLIAERRQKLENKIDSLLFKGAHARLASLFLELATEFGVKDSRGTIINLKLTHREMANLIGSTRETVSFALLDLKKEAVIQTDGKRVIILDGARLESLCDGR